ncbi:ZIP family metal transporter [Clostridium oceanicum]
MIGAFLGISIKNPSNKLLGKLIGFSAGLMLSVVVFDLIPEALSKHNIKNMVLCFILGISLIMVIDIKSNNTSINEHKKVAFLAAIGLMLHNFPEGMLMGCGFATGNNLGLKMSFIIAIHDIPEGIAVAAPLIASKEKPYKTLLYVFFTAFPTAIGSFIGIYMYRVSDGFIGILLSLASGIMLYVVCGNMIPESSKLYGNKIPMLFIIIGIIVGVFIINVL